METSVNSKKFTFKQEKAQGKFSSFSTYNIDVYLNKKTVGSIDHDNSKIRLMIIKDDINSDGIPNCVWKWITLAKVNLTVDDAKKFLNDNITVITTKYNLFMQEK